MSTGIKTAKATKATKGAKAEPEVKAPRLRSPNHPSLTLQDAVEKAKILHAKYGRVPIAVPLACSNWKYTNPKSSGALQTIATLKAYGLADVSGRGESQKIVVTDAAERIIRAAPDRPELLKMAAIAPATHNEVWDHFDKALPHDDIVRDYLLWERPEGSRFTDDAVAGFIERLRSTLQHAGLISDSGMSNDEQNTVAVDTAKNGNGSKALQREVRVGSFVQWNSKGVDQFPKPLKIVGIDGDWAFVENSQTGIPMQELTVVDSPKAETAATPPANPFYKPPAAPSDDLQPDGIAKELTTLDEGAVMLTLPKDLSPASVAEFDYWLQGVLRRVRRKAGLQPDGTVKKQ